MKLGDRVKHAEYGEGTIIYVPFKDTRRETFAIKFDVPNNNLHDCLGLVENHHGYFCNHKELKKMKI